MQTCLSIITVNYNDKVGLERTLSSVRSQTCHDFEYIVIDGDLPTALQNYFFSMPIALII